MLGKRWHADASVPTSTRRRVILWNVAIDINTHQISQTMLSRRLLPICHVLFSGCGEWNCRM